MSDKINIFWFRQDLRISDNAGFFEACQDSAVMPIYILDDVSAAEFKIGAASRWWLYHSLEALNRSLKNHLNVYLGSAEAILSTLIEQYDVKGIYWNRCYEPWRIKQDTKIKQQLKDNNITVKTFNASLLFEPWKILKENQDPYKIFTPYYRRTLLDIAPSNPIPIPLKTSFIKDINNSWTLMKLPLLPSKKWYEGMASYWDIGENAAQQKLKQFLENGLLGYHELRNYPAKPNVSKLSPHLHFGEISPKQIWHQTQAYMLEPRYTKDGESFLREIIWREFSYYLLYHFPDMPKKNFQSKFDRFPWQDNPEYLKAWQKGQTGYPIVDAGMRELWQTGAMHNRVRMVVASFLVKNLRIHWRHGEAWFWDCLVDADLANNSVSWQWVAGSGVDAAPYFRIFNPVTQGEKFDPTAEYTKKYVPELRLLPDKYLFRPWEAPAATLKSAGIVLGKTYPKPIVSLEESRAIALKAYKDISQPV